MSVTNRRIFATTSFLSFYYGAMNLGHHSVGVRNVVFKSGNSDMGIGNNGTGVGNNHMCIHRKFGLRIQS